MNKEVNEWPTIHNCLFCRYLYLLQLFTFRPIYKLSTGAGLKMYEKMGTYVLLVKNTETSLFQTFEWVLLLLICVKIIVQLYIIILKLRGILMQFFC
jgi:hypothetical protein